MIKTGRARSRTPWQSVDAWRSAGLKDGPEQTVDDFARIDIEGSTVKEEDALGLPRVDLHDHGLRSPVHRSKSDAKAAPWSKRFRVVGRQLAQNAVKVAPFWLSER